MVLVVVIAALKIDIEPAVHAVLGHDKRALYAAEFIADDTDRVNFLAIGVFKPHPEGLVAHRRVALVGKAVDYNCPLYRLARSVNAQVAIKLGLNLVKFAVGHRIVIGLRTKAVIALTSLYAG